MRFGRNNAACLSDESIVELYWMRDEQAIKETDVKYRGLLYSAAYNILYDKGDSEECLNDTYMGAWNSIPPARPSVLRAFLLTILRRTAIDRYKTAKRKKRIPSELTVSLSELGYLATDGEEAYSESEAKALAELLSEFLRSLSKRQAYIFMSRYYVARPIKETARLLGCSEATVNKEISAIKLALKQRLTEEGWSV